MEEEVLPRPRRKEEAERGHDVKGEEGALKGREKNRKESEAGREIKHTRTRGQNI